MDAISNVPVPENERIRGYAPGSAEREALEDRIKQLTGTALDLTMTIGGEQRLGGGVPIDVVQPHNHASVLGRTNEAARDRPPASRRTRRARCGPAAPSP
ncbi:L-glutamate gamma-semialdehyde dehydrogenase, partial [Nonomuraea sp. NPDC004297]